MYSIFYFESKKEFLLNASRKALQAKLVDLNIFETGQVNHR